MSVRLSGFRHARFARAEPRSIGSASRRALAFASSGRRYKGQALVEFALVLPILLLILLGLINVGILVETKLVLTNAAWEGARAGAVPSQPDTSDDEIRAAVAQATKTLDQSLLGVNISPQHNEPPRNLPYPEPRGSPLTVTLSYPLRLSFGFSITIPVTAQAVVRMEYFNGP